jgi:hypothetical protein
MIGCCKRHEIPSNTMPIPVHGQASLPGRGRSRNNAEEMPYAENPGSSWGSSANLGMITPVVRQQPAHMSPRYHQSLLTMPCLESVSHRVPS